MKNLHSSLLTSNVRLDGIAATALIMLIALGCTCGKDFDLANLTQNADRDAAANTSTSEETNRGGLPDDALLKATVKLTTAQFANAISTGDFSDIYAEASSDFKAAYTEEQMRDVFKNSIANKKRLLPILAKIVNMDPELSPEPYIRTEQGLSILVVTGKYDVKPQPVKFTYEYVKRNGQFRLLKLLLS